MKTLKPYWIALVVLATGMLAACSTARIEAADLSDTIHTALSRAGLKDVSVSQDREKGVVTLGGHVTADADKSQAAAIAKSIAGNQVVANEIAVVPRHNESDTKKVNSALDDAIKSSLDVELIRDQLDDRVKFTVRNHVVTLTGDVTTPSMRARAESIAAAVPNVQQVVNELQVKNQKATSSQ